MSLKSIPCPPEASLIALIDDTLSEDEERLLARHLDDCEACQKAMDALAGASFRTLANVEAMLEMDAEESRNSSARQTPPWASVFDRASKDPTDGVLGYLGRFEIVEHLASGGMGMVFKARDPGTDRMVALKVLAPIWAANPVARARFLGEARSAAALDHENLLAIYSVDDEGRYPYLVMPFNDGETLEQRVRQRGRLEFDEIQRIGLGIVKGLEAAHAGGIVHRDLKPANVLLRGQEAVRVADFGLARAADTPELTVKGSVPGTPQFMAPEQVKGQEVDSRADFFALGGILQYMATGAPPFGDGQSVSAILENVASAPPMKVARKQPPWFKELLEELLKKDPARRLTDTARIRTILEEGSPARSRRFVLGGIAATAGALTLAWLVAPRPKNVSAPVHLADLTKAYAVNVRTGDSFNDLSRAISQSRPGDTFELAGTFHLRAALVTAPNHPISCRPVAGATPTLVVSDERSRCLIINSDASFEGMRFVRKVPPPAEPRRFPTMVWVKKADEARFTRCRFEVAWERGVPTNGLTGCLGISEVKRCFIDQCEVIGMTAAGLNVSKGTPVPTRIDIRDTLIVAKRALMRNDESKAGEQTDLDCIFERCVVVAAEGFRHISYHRKRPHPLHPLTIEAHNSIIHSKYHLMRFPDATREHLRENLRWQSSDCRVAFGRAFIDCPRQFDRDHESYALPTLDESVALGMHATDERSGFHSLETNIYSELEALGAEGVTKSSVADVMPDGWPLPWAK